jgi:hypothetical protein
VELWRSQKKFSLLSPGGWDHLDSYPLEIASVQPQMAVETTNGCREASGCPRGVAYGRKEIAVSIRCT